MIKDDYPTLDEQRVPARSDAVTESLIALSAKSAGGVVGRESVFRIDRRVQSPPRVEGESNPGSTQTFFEAVELCPRLVGCQGAPFDSVLPLGRCGSQVGLDLGRLSRLGLCRLDARWILLSEAIASSARVLLLALLDLVLLSKRASGRFLAGHCVQKDERRHRDLAGATHSTRGWPERSAGWVCFPCAQAPRLTSPPPFPFMLSTSNC